MFSLDSRRIVSLWFSDHCSSQRSRRTSVRSPPTSVRNDLIVSLSRCDLSRTLCSRRTSLGSGSRAPLPPPALRRAARSRRISLSNSCTRASAAAARACSRSWRAHRSGSARGRASGSDHDSSGPSTSDRSAATTSSRIDMRTLIAHVQICYQPAPLLPMKTITTTTQPAPSPDEGTLTSQVGSEDERIDAGYCQTWLPNPRPFITQGLVASGKVAFLPA